MFGEPPPVIFGSGIFGEPPPGGVIAVDAENDPNGVAP
jgi:hypothetical protein